MESLQRICLREKGTLSVLFHESEIGFSWFGGLVLPFVSLFMLETAWSQANYCYINKEFVDFHVNHRYIEDKHADISDKRC